MKILPVKTPYQNEHTPTDQLEYVEYYEECNDVDGIMETKQYIPNWCVKSDRYMYIQGYPTSFGNWIERVKEEIERYEKIHDVKCEGIYLYDMGVHLHGYGQDTIEIYPRYALIEPRK